MRLIYTLNQTGAVQRIRLSDFLAALPSIEKHRVKVEGWETCRVDRGARTISISPDGRYVFAACNQNSSLCVVDTETFKMVGRVPVDSYPVGLEISADGQMVYVTSQGRNNSGGNAVNVFHIDY